MKSQRKRSFRRKREVHSVIKVREKEEIFEFFFFFSLFVVNLNVFLWEFCVFLKGIM